MKIQFHNNYHTFNSQSEYDSLIEINIVENPYAVKCI